MPKIAHILVFRLSAMGDAAMTVPVLRVLTKTYSNIMVTVVSRKHFEPLFSDIPNVNFMEADVYGKHKGFLGLLRLSKEAKKLGVTAVGDLHNVIRSKIVTKVLSIRGVKAVTLDKGRQEKKNIVNAEGGEIFNLKSMHQRYADVFGKLGFPIDLSKHEFPKRKELTPRLYTAMGKEPKKCIGIAPFAAYKSKTYPLKLMKEVIQHLDATNKYRILLFGGGSVEVEELKKLEIPFSSVTNIAGTMTFEEELGLISNLDVMLSMDSSNGHLAAIYGIPIITLWGVTHPYAGFTPFGQPKENQIVSDRTQFPLIPTSIYGNKFPEGYEEAMASILPKTVVDKIESIL